MGFKRMSGTVCVVGGYEYTRPQPPATAVRGPCEGVVTLLEVSVSAMERRVSFTRPHYEPVRMERAAGGEVPNTWPRSSGLPPPASASPHSPGGRPGALQRGHIENVSSLRGAPAHGRAGRVPCRHGRPAGPAAAPVRHLPIAPAAPCEMRNRAMFSGFHRPTRGAFDSLCRPLPPHRAPRPPPLLGHPSSGRISYCFH
jgi:hypothetical protein